MTVLRAIVIALLVWAAYWAALPWLDCLGAFTSLEGGPRVCTFGSPVGGPAFGLNLLLGMAYLAVAAVILMRRRAI